MKESQTKTREVLRGGGGGLFICLNCCEVKITRAQKNTLPVNYQDGVEIARGRVRRKIDQKSLLKGEMG